jgi:hypothetical protein
MTFPVYATNSNLRHQNGRDKYDHLVRVETEALEARCSQRATDANLMPHGSARVDLQKKAVLQE